MSRRVKIRKTDVNTSWRLAKERERLKKLESFRSPEPALERWQAYLKKRERHIRGLRSKAEMYTNFFETAQSKLMEEVKLFNRAVDSYVPMTKAASKKR